MEAPSGGILSIAWSPDANRLAYGAADGTVRLCDVSGKSEVCILRGHTSDVYGVVWLSNVRLASSFCRLYCTAMGLQ